MAVIKEVKVLSMRKFTKKSLLVLVCLVFSLLLMACSSLPTPSPTIAGTTPTNPPSVVSPVKAPIATPAPTQVPTITSQYNQILLAGTPVNIYVPAGIYAKQQAQLLVILHGMGGAGEPMLKPLMEYADQNKWVLLAPTFRYSSDWQNPNTVAQEDPRLVATLNQMTEEVVQYIGMPVKSQLLLYGFSRGAQLAHRYALMYPEKTLSVAVISGGSYTLPFRDTTDAKLAGYLQPFEREGIISFPFGVGDLENYSGKTFNEVAFKRVNFWVQVGQLDNKNSEVSRAYDSYIGLNRVERATNFYNALKQIGVNATLTVFPDVAHATTKEMQFKACNYFKSALQTKQNKVTT